MSRPRRGGPAAALVLGVCLTLAACQEVEESAADAYEPATLGEKTAAGVQQVTFTAEAARRVDLHTVPVAASGPRTVVPYPALLYDAEGLSWVYTAPAPLTFLRAQVGVDRIDGDQVLLMSGPPAGTAVVTVGAAEVYGAELDIAGSH